MAKHIRHNTLAFIISLIVLALPSQRSWSTTIMVNNACTLHPTQLLTDTLSKIATTYPGEIGVALIINDTDTVTVNNRSIYPMMSVFKVHQALAICNDFDHKGLSLDSMMTMHRDLLNQRTWSPMMKEHTEPVIALSVKDLLRYTLTMSDNNASNFMFQTLVNTVQTDSFIATIIPRSSFQVMYTEAEMADDHDKAYDNFTSPLGAAILMNRLFTDSLVSHDKQSFIKKALEQCHTGQDCIVSPLSDKTGIVVAHKTGSGYTNKDGVLTSHNDIAFIRLRNGEHYTLAVFVKDFNGNATQASKAIAHISATAYSLVTDQ